MIVLMFAAIGGAALVYGLLYALRQYEKDSVATALEESKAIRAEMEGLERRIENLEAIAASESASSAYTEEQGTTRSQRIRN